MSSLPSTPVFTFLPARQVNLLCPGAGKGGKPVWLSLQHHHLLHSYISERLVAELGLPTYPDPQNEGRTLVDVPLAGGNTTLKECIVVPNFEPLKQLVPSKFFQELRNTGATTGSPGACEEDWKSPALKKSLVTLAEVDLKVPTFLGLDTDQDIEPVEEEMEILLGQQHYITHLLLDVANQTFLRPTADLLYSYTRLNDCCGGGGGGEIDDDDDGGDTKPIEKGPLSTCRWVLTGCLRTVADLRPLLEFDDEADFEVVPSFKKKIPPRTGLPVPAEPFPLYQSTLCALVSFATNRNSSDSWLPVRILYSPTSPRSYLTLEALERLLKHEKGNFHFAQLDHYFAIRIQRKAAGGGDKDEDDKEEGKQQQPIQLTLPVLDTVQTCTPVPALVAHQLLASYDVELSDGGGGGGGGGGDCNKIIDLVIGQDYASRLLPAAAAAPVEIPVAACEQLQSGLLLQTKLGWTLSGFGDVADCSIPVDKEEKKKELEMIFTFGKK